MPEGDTLFRTAAVLREVLGGRTVIGARGRPGGASLGRVVGSRVQGVEAQGKHLLIGFENGLTLHTHLRMHGSWHRYRPGERWRRSPNRAVAVIEVPDGVAVCFDAPTVELIETRALALHPALSALGPDLLEPEPDLAEAVRRLAHPARSEMTIGDALLDQRVMAGLGNVYRSEVCFVAGVDPFTPVGRLDRQILVRIVEESRRLLAANRLNPARITVPPTLGAPAADDPRASRTRLWVYGRAGRPCRRCGSRIRSGTSGELARRVYWCPTCQPQPISAPVEPRVATNPG